MTTNNATVVDINDCSIDSDINWRKILILLAPFAFFIPISIDRSEALAIDNVEKLRDAISTIRNASPENIQIYI